MPEAFETEPEDVEAVDCDPDVGTLPLLAPEETELDDGEPEVSESGPETELGLEPDDVESVDWDPDSEPPLSPPEGFDPDAEADGVELGDWDSRPWPSRGPGGPPDVELDGVDPEPSL